MKTIEEIKQDKELQKYFKKSSTFARIIKHGYDIVELYQAMLIFKEYGLGLSYHYTPSRKWAKCHVQYNVGMFHWASFNFNGLNEILANPEKKAIEMKKEFEERNQECNC